METNWNQLIERYLNGELSAEGKLAFEQQLREIPELQKELDLHQLTQNLIKRAAVRNMVTQSAKSYHLKKTLTTTAIVVLALAAVLTIVLAIRNVNSTNENPTEEVVEEALLKEMNKDLQLENVDVQYFKFIGQDDIFLSESGVLLSITDGSFLLNGSPYKGEVIVQWQEAQEASDIIKAGLSTLNGNNLLETQGMFSLNAYTPNGKQLDLSSKGIYVQVPVDELKKDMKLFNGVKGKNGMVDWQNPVELERLPKPKDMAKMDLFPPKYEPKLNELKWFTDKVKRDSLYLSFDETIHVSEKDAQSGEPKGFLLNDIPSVEKVPITRNKNEAIHSGSQFTMAAFGKAQQAQNLQVETATTNREEGELLFTLKCASCHHLNGDGTGPNLKGVRKRWSEGGAKEGSIYKWVADWTKAVAADPYASNVMKYRQVTMDKFPELTGQYAKINSIFDYIDSQPEIQMTDSIPQKSHIPPSKVLAIWDKKFNHTNLATRDFEDRMKFIHQTCNEKVFDVYASNLSTPFWKLDERVVKLGYPEFQQFVDQKVGSVKISDEHQKNLSAFYDQAIKTLRSKGKDAVLAAWKKDQEWDQSVEKDREKEIYRRGVRNSLNKDEEANYNLKYLSKQLGTTLGFAITNETFSSHYPNLKIRPNAKRVTPRSLPIMVNIDRLTPQLLSSRQSVTVNMMDKSKSTKLVYSAFRLKVDSHQKFDRLYFYLMSNALNSFERLDFNNGSLNYTLNKAFGYDAVIVGINENGYFIHEIQSLKPMELGTITLQQVSEAEFNKRVNTMNAGRNVHRPMDIKSELDWLFKEKTNYTVLKQRRENAEFRAVIRPTIYSCEVDGATVPIQIQEPSNKKFARDTIVGEK